MNPEAQERITDIGPPNFQKFLPSVIKAQVLSNPIPALAEVGVNKKKRFS